MDGDVDLRLQFALAQQTDSVQLAAHQTGRNQCVLGDRSLGVQFAGFDELLDQARLMTANSLRFGLLKPRLGRRWYSGI